MSREHGNGRIVMSCVHSHWSGNVPISTLRGYHASCNSWTLSQHRDCLAAIHRYCKATLGSNFAGTSQEVPSSNSLYVKCFESSRKEHVSHAVLRAKHGGCRYPHSHSDNCYAAASRWCVSVGHSGGITQEVNEVGITVACYRAEFSNDAFVTRSNDFYIWEFRVAQICSFDFDVANGTILSQTAQFLKTETYDNRASSIALRGSFQVSKNVAESSSFTHSHSYTIGTNISISVRIPFFGGGSDIRQSSSSTTGVSLTRQSMRSTSYTTQSQVEVPAGEGIVKEAIVQRANLEVPWSARIINALGVA